MISDIEMDMQYHCTEGIKKNREGGNSRRKGVALSANPYNESENAFRYWQEGWASEDELLRARKGQAEHGNGIIDVWNE